MSDYTHALVVAATALRIGKMTPDQAANMLDGAAQRIAQLEGAERKRMTVPGAGEFLPFACSEETRQLWRDVHGLPAKQNRDAERVVLLRFAAAAGRDLGLQVPKDG